MKKKLNKENKKIRVTITMNNEINKLINSITENKSKYIEWLIYKDLIKNNIINDDFKL